LRTLLGLKMSLEGQSKGTERNKTEKRRVKCE